ncbi:hypothetical protein SAMN05660841_02637 [Sphingobacterium nematocida]|uniref:Uncharacterized protein n=1 Tax=Sphingobacterium nematocida TaxID=1513896 RepID=A0A1T5EJT8_9SPHI|nr:hypothetical protein SAMN05660841_02637 [Sphingobacterium nematocida]
MFTILRCNALPDEHYMGKHKGGSKGGQEMGQDGTSSDNNCPSVQEKLILKRPFRKKIKIDRIRQITPEMKLYKLE